jgi:RNA polymerase sigma-70 factor (ECF subfamily)
MKRHTDLGALVNYALLGDSPALRALVDALSPVIQARVARALLRGRAGRRQRRDLRQDVEDFTQEVFVALFENDARALRSWRQSRGLSLANFVGLIAEHQVAAILRSGRRNPWTEEPTRSTEIDQAAGAVSSFDRTIHSRDLLLKLLDRLHAELSPRGYQLFCLLCVDERPPSDVCDLMGISLDALYAFRSRVAKTVRRLAMDLEPCEATGIGRPRPWSEPLGLRDS